MTLKKETKLVKFDVNVEHKTVSIALDTVILENGEEISRKRHRCSFAPGDLDKVKEYLGVDKSPELDLLKKMWPAKVVKEYLANA